MPDHKTITPIRRGYAEPDYDRLDETVAALIKGMLVRGDKQSDIAACFLINLGRVSEINTGQRYARVVATPDAELPPPGPYMSPYDLWRSQHELRRARAALESLVAAIQEAAAAIRKAEFR